MTVQTIAAVCPDERETLRCGAYLVESLITNMLDFDESLGWKNELSVSTMLKLRDDWLPHAASFFATSPTPDAGSRKQ